MVEQLQSQDRGARGFTVFVRRYFPPVLDILGFSEHGQSITDLGSICIALDFAWSRDNSIGQTCVLGILAG